MYEKDYFKPLIESNPIPACIVDSDNKVVCVNRRISNVFIYDGIERASFFALTGIKQDRLERSCESGESISLERNDRKFNVIADYIDGKADFINVVFIDVTDYENLEKKYRDSEICSILLHIDNYDELIATNSEKNISLVRSKVDDIIRNWAEKMSTSINKLSKNQYKIYVEHKEILVCIKNKFPILDEIRKIETESDFPMSISLGIGMDANTLRQKDEFAQVAMDLALGRGGDQAVVKDINTVKYYGGSLQTVEKSNKGKSRVVAHALKRLIAQSEEIFIMGHRYPDMDAFGAALGITRLCMAVGKSPKIVINDYNDALKIIYNEAKNTGYYEFIGSAQAIEEANKNSMVITLDTNRETLAECPQLLEICDKKAVIDHHRRMEDYIRDATLYYVESYASSTCELVAEILQSVLSKKDITKLEAEAMLAGMTVDTNRFAVKTGVRTFEAASWLKRVGADTTEVKKYFQTELSDFKVRAKGIANAEFYYDEFAISICEGENHEAQIINSQVADELLTIKGMKATFVMGKNQNSKTVISARSLGKINVQVIMEKFGGGGHLNAAGAQVDDEPEKIKRDIVKIIDEIKELEK